MSNSDDPNSWWAHPMHNLPYQGAPDLSDYLRNEPDPRSYEYDHGDGTDPTIPTPAMGWRPAPMLSVHFRPAAEDAAHTIIKPTRNDLGFVADGELVEITQQKVLQKGGGKSQSYVDTVGVKISFIDNDGDAINYIQFIGNTTDISQIDVNRLGISFRVLPAGTLIER